jgi:hypothetical protein
MRWSWLVALALLLVCACGRSGVTASRLENAIARTFSNLVRVQEGVLGGPSVDAATLRASASCKRVDTTSSSWRCTITWFIPGHPAPVRDTYDVSVTMDGCYTATADGAEAHVGGPTLKTMSGATVTNLVYVFDGCFDTTS